ncbi:hypothetical protein NW759_015249 [Fusarium solani]|nr:hypothetical protein NW759_015249 [Fusarium solani]
MYPPALCHSTVILLFVSFVAISARGNAQILESKTLAKNFASPKSHLGPHVYWHWMNGNINKDGLDKDLAAMAEAGHGGALIKDVQAGLPEGPVTYGSREWLDLVVHAVEGLEKRGVQAAMHNSPGYSGVGSHALPVNETMKELVWTESRITANSSSDTILPKPFSKLGVYQDLFTLTYLTGQGEGYLVFRDAVQEVRINETAVKTNGTSTIDRTNPLRLESKSAKFDIAFKEPFTAQAIAIYRIPELPLNTFDGARDYPPQWSVFVSNYSVDWTSVPVTVSAPALRQMDATAVITFNQVKAKYLRLVPSGPTWITGIDVSSSPRLPNWAVKTHGAPGTVTAASLTTADLPSIDPSSIIDASSHFTNDGKLKRRPSNDETCTVVRIGYTVTGQEMPATPDRYGGLSVDLFSKKSIDAHFDTHLTRVIKALKPYISRTFYGFEIDSYELGMQNWGGDLEDEFILLRGYSLRPWILAARGRIIGSTEKTEKFLYDFRLTYADLVKTNSCEYF